MRTFVLAIALVLTTLVVATGGRSADCPVVTGAHVSLQSPLDDPHVLLWHSQRVLLDYLAGRWDGEALASTYLIQPGTSAIVETACPDGNRGIAGVRVKSGRHAGAFGWVDIHDIR